MVYKLPMQEIMTNLVGYRESLSNRRICYIYRDLKFCGRVFDLPNLPGNIYVKRIYENL